MSNKSREQLLNELTTAIRSNGQKGITTAADMRSFLSSLVDELINRTDVFDVASYQNTIFEPIAQNKYGIHPAFSTQAALNSWLLGHINTTVTATGYGAYGTGGYSGINADLLNYEYYRTLPFINGSTYTHGYEENPTQPMMNRGFAGDVLTVNGHNLANGVIVHFDANVQREGHATATLFNVNDDGTQASLIVPDTCIGKRGETGYYIESGNWFYITPSNYYHYLGVSSFDWFFPMNIVLSSTSGAPNTLITIMGRGVSAIKSMRLGGNDNGSNTAAVQRDPNDASRATAVVPATAGSVYPNLLQFFMEELKPGSVLGMPIASTSFTLLS